MLGKYLVPGFGVALAASTVFGYVQTVRIDGLKNENEALKNTIEAMDVRLTDIKEDIASDREIDELDVEGLRNLASEWLREDDDTDP